MKNQCQPQQGRAVPLNRLFKSKDCSLISTTDRRGLEKLPTAYLFEIEAPIVSDALFLETDLKSKPRVLWPKKSIRNRVPFAIAPPVSPMNRRLCSSLGVAAFGQEWTETNLYGCGISALADRRHSAPASSSQPSHIGIFNALPHENDN
jgi:hypothetical protein